jgi:phosphoribosyl-AMP cyclohydrolase
VAGSDSNIVEEKDYYEERRHDLFEKGQSKRIWGELYKVLDCSDVVIQVSQSVGGACHGGSQDFCRPSRLVG